ncbi:MAG: hypothetical protein HY445_01030 [Candidatus Niyogibacteria bacterium]|nr:hypothetical protein [Candidatus Niyogibacteria bacterium]
MSSLLKIIPFSILNLAFLAIAYAQDCTGASPDCTPNPVESGTFGELITKLALIITEVSLPFVVFFLILAALIFVFARGNPEQLTRAKKIMWWAIIGAAIIVGAWTIAIAIDNFGKALTG